MTARQDSVDIVKRFFNEVWAAPQNPHAIDHMVAEDFVITSGGKDIVSRAAFKEWVLAFYELVENLDFEIIESFQSPDGRRVACRWRLTGRNRGLMGTEPNGEPIEMVGTAIWEVGEDGLLRHNWVERNAWEVFSGIRRLGERWTLIAGLALAIGGMLGVALAVMREASVLPWSCHPGRSRCSAGAGTSPSSSFFSKLRKVTCRSSDNHSPIQSRCWASETSTIFAGFPFPEGRYHATGLAIAKGRWRGLPG